MTRAPPWVDTTILYRWKWDFPARQISVCVLSSWHHRQGRGEATTWAGNWLGIWPRGEVAWEGDGLKSSRVERLAKSKGSGLKAFGRCFVCSIRPAAEWVWGFTRIHQKNEGGLWTLCFCVSSFQRNDDELQYNSQYPLKNSGSREGTKKKHSRDFVFESYFKSKFLNKSFF